MQIEDLYEENCFLLQGDILSEGEREQYLSVNADMDDVYAEKSLNRLCNYLSRYYGKNVIILLDEYDTPMQEAYLGGYWDEFMQFIRSLFNAAFKTNPYLERAVMTGVTRVSKESIFSDLNNLMVVTTTSNQYSTCFGFTEDEVFGALEEMGLAEEKGRVKDWYDGFAFGKDKDIYKETEIIGNSTFANRAKTIGFIHPKNGEYMEFSAPLPNYFDNLLKMLYNSIKQ